MLTDATGRQIPKGPTDVVVDKEAVKRGRDPEVLNGVSCMNCHWSGMLNKQDQIREHVLGQPNAYSKEILEFVAAVYPPASTLDAKLKEDRARFEAAVKLCGLPGLARSEPVATLGFQFDDALDLDLAAAETGVSRSDFIAAIRGNPALARDLGSLPNGQTIPRETFVQVFDALINACKVGRVLPRAELELAPEITNSIGMNMKRIPAGDFLMGTRDSDVPTALKADVYLKAEQLDPERPQHRVKITRPFYVATFEVTQSQFETVMGRNPSWFVESGEGGEKVKAMDTGMFPAEQVTWFDAIQFCNTLSQSER
jgi:formylglycine-generating enzyme required for sulfatase activity